MALKSEDISFIVKTLTSFQQSGGFVLDEYIVVGQFWESLKKHIKDETTSLEFELLDVLVKILNVVLSRRGGEPQTLRALLDLLDQVEALRDASKPTDSK